jgi:hypothetical protein
MIAIATEPRWNWITRPETSDCAEGTALPNALWTVHDLVQMIQL